MCKMHRARLAFDFLFNFIFGSLISEARHQPLDSRAVVIFIILLLLYIIVYLFL